MSKIRIIGFRKRSNNIGDLLEDISCADIAFLNLESPLCNSDISMHKSGPAIKASPFSVKAIKSAGFDVVGLASNQIMDYGGTGLQETLTACREHNIKT